MPHDNLPINGKLQAMNEGTGILLRILYPIAPHITCSLWRDLGFAADMGDLLDAPWPEVDETALVQDQLDLVLQINGKHRGSIEAANRAQGGLEVTIRLPLALRVE